MMVRTCPECRQAFDQHAARGLCHTCWKRLRYHGRLGEYSRRLRPAAETVDEADSLLEQGCTTAQIAEILGVQWASIRRARGRHVAAMTRARLSDEISVVLASRALDR